MTQRDLSSSHDPRLLWLRDAICESTVPLDDMATERVLRELGPSIDKAREHAGCETPGYWIPRWLLASGVTAMVAAIVALVWVWNASPRQPISAPAQLATKGGQLVAPPTMQPREKMHRGARGGVAFDVSRGSVGHPMPDGPVDADLEGPARIRALRSLGKKVSMELTNGMLVASFDGGSGRALEVRAGALTVRVVGTLFLVRRAGMRGTERVAVDHGTVRIRQASGAEVVLWGGYAWTPVHGLSALTTSDKAAFARWRGRRPRAKSEEKQGVKVASRTDSPRAQRRSRPSQPPGPPKQRGVESVYHQAETALRRGDRRRYRQLLLELVGRWPGATAALQARFELARSYWQSGELGALSRQLSELLGTDEHPLREAAHYLSCQLALRKKQHPRAGSCLRAFLARYPRSSRAARVRGYLSRLQRSPQ